MQKSELSNFYVAVGKHLRHQREHLGLTQEQLSHKVGVSRTAVTNIEKGKQQIALHQVFAFSRALGVQPESMLNVKLPSDYSWLSEKLEANGMDEDIKSWAIQLG